jgi:class 3 adenylate cyclase
MLDPAWIAATFKSLDPKDVKIAFKDLLELNNPIVLAIQPVIWAVGAAVTSVTKRSTKGLGLLGSNAVAALAGVGVLALGAAVAASFAKSAVPWSSIAVAALASLGVGLVFAVIFDRLFPVVPVVLERRPPTTQSVATDDADVDELLRLISTAEEKLSTQHTTQKIVMITDMKSFSAMTEQDGSVMTAKAIQRHRDLLLPVIERFGGSGKSTGGDGLVAAFDVRSNAIAAAAAMQQILTKYNEDHPQERELLVRIGVAQGEVVLDKHGRPFIGAGLNLSARVMNLADGGQAFVTSVIASAAPEAKVKVASLGDYELKNIQKPVEVFEVLWAEGQEPRPPAH